MFMTDEEILETAKKFDDVVANFGDLTVNEVKNLYYYIKTLANIRGLEVDL